MYKNFFRLIFFVVVGLSAQQNPTISPSQLVRGLGGIEQKNGTGFSAFGSSQAVFADKELQWANPSTSVFLQHPLLSLQVAAKFAFFEENKRTSFRQFYGLEQVGLGFAIHKIWGTYLGFSPFSSNTYKYIQEKENKSIAILEGRGNVYQLLFGNSFLIFQNKLHLLSLGFNFKYFFGKVVDSKAVEFEAINAFNSRFLDQTFWNDFTFDFGFSYQIHVHSDWRLGLGGTYTLGKPMQVQSVQETQNYFYNSAIVPIYSDPIASTSAYKKIDFPHAFAVGLSAVYLEKLTLASDFSYQFSGFRGSLSRSLWRWGAAAEFIPGGKNVLGLAAYQRLLYRLGTQIGNTVQGNGLFYAFKTGLGIPISYKYLYSRMHLSLEYGFQNKGFLAAENFISLGIGFDLGPTHYERWFQRRKYN